MKPARIFRIELNEIQDAYEENDRGRKQINANKHEVRRIQENPQ